MPANAGALLWLLLLLLSSKAMVLTALILEPAWRLPNWDEVHAGAAMFGAVNGT